jgi:RNA polymerase sigma-70 factor (ECF subfamily)
VKQSGYSYWSDQELLEKYRKDRNVKWLGELLERYFHLIFGVCMKYLKNETEAKDQTQQICLKVITVARKEKITYFKSWLYQVTKNHCLMYLRKAKQIPVSLNLWQETAAENTFNKDQFLEKENQYGYLDRAMNLLNEAQRNCIELFYFQKKTYQEIADEKGFSVKQVKSHIQNGKRNLRLQIERMSENESDV